MSLKSLKISIFKCPLNNFRRKKQRWTDCIYIVTSNQSPHIIRIYIVNTSKPFGPFFA